MKGAIQYNLLLEIWLLLESQLLTTFLALSIKFPFHHSRLSLSGLSFCSMLISICAMFPVINLLLTSSYVWLFSAPTLWNLTLYGQSSSSDPCRLFLIFAFILVWAQPRTWRTVFWVWFCFWVLPSRGCSHREHTLLAMGSYFCCGAQGAVGGSVSWSRVSPQLLHWRWKRPLYSWMASLACCHDVSVPQMTCLLPTPSCLLATWWLPSRVALRPEVRWALAKKSSTY